MFFGTMWAPLWAQLSRMSDFDVTIAVCFVKLLGAPITFSNWSDGSMDIERQTCYCKPIADMTNNPEISKLASKSNNQFKHPSSLQHITCMASPKIIGFFMCLPTGLGRFEGTDTAKSDWRRGGSGQ